MGKKFLFFFVHIVLNYFNGTICDEIDYYEELIKNNLQNLTSYQTPIYYKGYEIEDVGLEAIDFGTFDFIIVGGGTAGSLLANRLSENKNWSVLLLEAGGLAENYFTDIPSMSYNLFSSDFNWGFKTTEQNTGCNASREIYSILPRGKALGGSTVINGNNYVRGSPSDFNIWSIDGLRNWSFENVLPYFKKFENATTLENIERDFHGFEGPVTIENYQNTSKISEAIVESLNSLGYQVVDFNGANPIGVGYVQKSTKNGKRLSVFRAFLESIQYERSNLKIQVDSFVTKILLEENKAVGVEFVFKNIKHVVKANLEVIISAGSFQSPQILMLSGIGPRNQLLKHQIPVILDLPVGENLKDNYVVGISATTNFTNPLSVKKIINDYLNGFGPMTISGGIETLTFFNTSNSTLELISTISNNINLVDDTLVFDAASEVSLMFYLTLLHPKSIGSITLKSKDHLDFPLIDPNYLDDEEDVRTLKEGVRFLLKVLKSDPLKKFNVSLTKNAECENFLDEIEEYWDCVIRCSGGSGSHPSSTCKMGNNSIDSVVDERLLVHGMKNLRVVDASIIPVRLTGHMFGAVYMIAEKAADIIKEDHQTN